MTVAEVLDFVRALGPLAKEHGIDTIEFEDGPHPQLKSIKFRPSLPPQLVAALAQKKEQAEEKPRPTFAGRSADDIRSAIPNWGSDG